VAAPAGENRIGFESGIDRGLQVNVYGLPNFESLKHSAQGIFSFNTRRTPELPTASNGSAPLLIQ